MTLGRPTKMATLANSILAATDQATQLRLYTDLYNSLPQGYLSLFNVADVNLGSAPATPASLANASMAQIKTALQALASDWQRIGAFYTISQFPGGALACSQELGAGAPLDPTVYGDRSRNTDTCSIPSPKGIVANFDFPLKSSLTCVKDQGNRTICHTFATVSAIEMLISEDLGTKVNLSEQALMERYRYRWAPAFLDDGGNSWDISHYVIANNYHLPYESSWDYNPSYDRLSFIFTVPYIGLAGTFVRSCDNYPEPCSDSAPQVGMVCSFYLNHLYCAWEEPAVAGSPYTITGTSDGLWDVSDTETSADYILLYLGYGRGVVLTLQTTPRFVKGGYGALDPITLQEGDAIVKPGYVNYDPNDVKTSSGSHLVHVVGYISDYDLHQKVPDAPVASGHGWLIIKNSWSNCWGDGGYGYLAWDYVKSQTTHAYAIMGVQ